MNFWEGQNISLRSIEVQDATFFYEWNKETEVQEKLDQIWFPSSLRRQEQWVEKMAVRSVDDEGFFFVIQNQEKQPVGMVHTKDCDRLNSHFSYAVAVKTAFQRKGIASEAIQLVLNYYFNHLNYHKVMVQVYAFNAGSIALHQKLGFQLEGQFRKMKYYKGQFYDILHFGLLKSEFIHPS